MLTISAPITAPNHTSSAGFVVSLLPDNYAPAVVVRNSHPVNTIIPSTPPAIVDGIIVVPAPEDTVVGTIVINGITYGYTIAIPPPAGYFTQIDGQLQIGYLGLVSPASIAYYSTPQAIPTNRVLDPFPELFTQFPITGELSWTLTWEEQPQASFEFITDASYKDAAIAYFTAHRNINIYGVGFSPNGQISITEISLTKSAVPLIKVSVNLTGTWAKYLDFNTYLGKQNYSSDCTTTPSAALYNSPDSMSVQDLAEQVGAKLTGASINIPYSVLKSQAVITTLGAYLDSPSVRGVGAFINYNSVNAIELKSYSSVPTWIVNRVRSDISSSINHKIDTDYYKTYDPPQKVTYGTNSSSSPTNTSQTEYQPVPSVTTTTYDGDPDPSVSPYVGVQTDLSIVFDISGKRKRRKTTKLLDGQPVSEIEEEWGYVAVGKDNLVFDPSSNPKVLNITGIWQQIESKRTDYTYNGLGYLTAVNSSGWQLARFRTENAQKPESLSIRVDTGDAGEIANLKTYRFFRLATSSSEIYELELMSQYYNDIKTPQIARKFCLPDGTIQEQSIDDPKYVPPYFVRSKYVRQSGSASVVNPKSTALKPLPQLTTGKSAEFIERINIASPDAGASNPTYYTKSTDNYSAQGAQLGTNLAIAESSLVMGRPPTATIRSSSSQTATQPPTTYSTATELYTPFVIKSGLTGEDVGYLTAGTLNFPTAATKDAALLAAQIDIDIINARNTQVESLTIDLNTSIRPGDKLVYRVGNTSRRRRVIGVTQKLKIEGMLNDGETIVTSAGTDVKLGVDLTTPVSIVKYLTRSTSIVLR